MFTMMNTMRLGVGIHSLGLAQRALQLAREFAHERVQGRGPSGAQRPIIEHADVRRMLLQMKALTYAARGLVYTAAATLDVSQLAPDEATRAAALNRASLLTPVVKAWVSEIGNEVASLGVQVHGGTGYVDDAEISQVYRDSRIGPIFEGTNYIQAQDLLGRKIVRERATTLNALLDEIDAAATELPADLPQLATLRFQLATCSKRLREATGDIVATACHRWRARRVDCAPLSTVAGDADRGLAVGVDGQPRAEVASCGCGGAGYGGYRRVLCRARHAAGVDA